jgi:DNA-binding beta-propeller fold protein YncE
MAAFFSVFCITCLLFFTPSSFSAEIARFQHTQSVYLDDKGVGLNHPEGIACNEKSLVIVGDTGNDRLLRFTFEGKTVKSATEIRIPQVSNPICVQINSKGEIFVLDGKYRRIARLESGGSFTGYLGAEGLPTLSTFIPRSFKVDRDDAIYILDVYSARVMVLNAAGKYQKQIEFPKEYGFFSDLAIDAKGTILLIDSINARIYSAARDATTFSALTGSLKEYLNFPISITTDKRGIIYVADSNGGTIGLIAQDGAFLGKRSSMGWNEGLLYYPSQTCVNEKDEVFIADRGNSRVQIFTLVK